MEDKGCILPSSQSICRIVTQGVWDTVLKEKTKIPMTELDIQDGFVHLSTIEQVLETANRYFTVEQNPKILVLKEKNLQDALKWEVVPHRNHQVFPHLYRQLQFEDVLGVWDVRYQSQFQNCFVLDTYRKIIESSSKVVKSTK